MNDIAYFITLLRYIHQNPVKAGMVAEVKDYEFSSWDEYIDKNSTLFPYVTLALLMLIKEKTGATNSSAFQQLPADIKKSVYHKRLLIAYSGQIRT